MSSISNNKSEPLWSAYYMDEAFIWLAFLTEFAWGTKCRDFTSQKQDTVWSIQYPTCGLCS